MQTPNLAPLTLAEAIDGYIVATPSLDESALGRLDYWRGALGSLPLASIDADAVDEALTALARRGRLRPVAGGAPIPTGRPLAPATLNRHLTTLASVYKWAKRQRLLRRAHVTPTVGIERFAEKPDPNRYLRAEEVERLIKAAKVCDRQWGRLPALIRLGFTTGLRKGNLMGLRWRDIDMAAMRISVAKTKNGDAHVAILTPQARDALLALSGRGDPEALVFGNRAGKPYNIRNVWRRTTEMAGLNGRNFHQLRHGCGSEMARRGAAQAQIMAVLGHKTLTASARYVHLSVEDRADVINGIFQ
jgi:integrase